MHTWNYNKQVIVLILSIIIVAAAAKTAQSFSTHNVHVSREIDSVTVIVGESASATVEITNLESSSLCGLCFTEYLPPGLDIDAISVRIDGITIDDYQFETDIMGDVYLQYRSYRWVLETPYGFAEDNSLAQNSTVQIVYSIYAYEQGTYEMANFSWFGYYLDGGRAAFGFSESDSAVYILFGQRTYVDDWLLYY